MLASGDLESDVRFTHIALLQYWLCLWYLLDSLNSVVNVSKILSVFDCLFFFCQALEECLKSHLGNDIITSRNELTSQVKIRGSYKDEVFTLLKRLGF